MRSLGRGEPGGVIRKTGIDPRGNWFDPTSRITYQLKALSLPAGDLDGDGTADLVLDRSEGGGLPGKTAGNTLAIDLLSGRTGARIWSGGHLPDSPLRKANMTVQSTEACIVDGKGRSDLIVAQSGDFGNGVCSLARVSGRDGRVLWEVELPQMGFTAGDLPLFLEDLDGDGALDALAVVSPGGIGGGDHSAVAISLRDGKRLWTANVALGIPLSVWRRIRVGDVDGDKRAEVVVIGEPFPSVGSDTTVRMLDGRDGTLRWQWDLKGRQYSVVESRDLALADFDGDGTRRICVSAWEMEGPCVTVVLDASGKERARSRLGDRNGSDVISPP